MPFTLEGQWIPSEPSPLKKKIQVRKIKRKKSEVTLIENLSLPIQDLNNLCSQCKKKWGCGGVVKEKTIELQGDKVELVISFLQDSHLL